MEPWELAVRAYKRLVPEPVETWSCEFPLRQLQIWLTDDVCPVVEDYARRPAFRNHAAWAVTALRPAAQTAERALVDALEQGLPRCAAILTRLADAKLVRQKLIALYSPQPMVAEGTEEIGDGPPLHRDVVLAPTTSSRWNSPKSHNCPKERPRRWSGSRTTSSRCRNGPEHRTAD